MIYGNPPFHSIPGGPLSKMNKIADPTHRIEYPSNAVFQRTAMTDGPSEPTMVAVPSAAITTMRGCLDYHKDRRLTIPQLLEHDFLSSSGSAYGKFGRLRFQVQTGTRADPSITTTRRDLDHERTNGSPRLVRPALSRPPGPGDRR